MLLNPSPIYKQTYLRYMTPLLFGSVLALSVGINILGSWLAKRIGTPAFFPPLIAFSAGTVIGIALLHLAPEVAELEESVWGWAAFAFVALYLVEHHFAPHFHHADQHDCAHKKQKRWAIFLGFAMHALFDGMVIGAGFAIHPVGGWVVALGVLIHELPEGIVTYSTLKEFGLSEKAAFLQASLIALITPIGAILTLFIALLGTQAILATAMSLAFGSLLYVGTADLLPQVAHQKGWKSTIFLIVGFLFAYGLTFFHVH
jgi:zinc and cadmium transporter